MPTLYIYNCDTNEIIAQVTRNTNTECEEAVDRYFGDEIGGAYSKQGLIDVADEDKEFL